MSKPFFFRITAAELIDFATDEESEGITLLKFAKELQKGQSNILFIQSIIDEAHNYIEKKRISGGKGGKAKANKEKANPSTAIAPLENAIANPSETLARSSNSNRSSNNKEKKVKTYCHDSLRLSEKLADYVLKNNPNGSIHLQNGKRENTTKSWSEDIERLHRIDGQDFEQIEKVIEWCQNDSFWKSNILSADKLRKQWPKLTAKMNFSNSNTIQNIMTAKNVKTLADLKMFPIDSRPAIMKSLPDEIQDNIRFAIRKERGVSL